MDERDYKAMNYMTTPQQEYYTYKGGVYRKLDEIQHKNNKTREWDVKVLYQDAKGLLYTRDIDEFYSKFTQIDAFCIDAVKFKVLFDLVKK